MTKGKLMCYLSKAALMLCSVVAVTSTAETCYWVLHQPKEPDMLSKMSE